MSRYIRAGTLPVVPENEFTPKVYARGSRYCSMCHTSEHDTRLLIAGMSGFICKECVSICVDIVSRECPNPPPPPPDRRAESG